MIITVDGPAASGKGTLARRLADRLGYAHLDTGRLYRAVGLALLRAGGDPGDAEAAAQVARRLDPATLDDPELAGEAAGNAASVVGAIPAVRAALLAMQREFTAHPPGGRPGAVLDGRDTGTVVCPQAQAKLFLTASAEERARRRDKELQARGEASIYARVLAEIKERDRRDTRRAVAPLKPAEDAVVIDTTGMDADAVFAAAWHSIRARLDD